MRIGDAANREGLFSLSLDASQGGRCRRLRGGGAVLLMFMLAAGAGTAWGQLDPNDPCPKFAHDERNSCRSPYRGPHSEPELRWWSLIDSAIGGDEEDRYGLHVDGAAIARIGQTPYIIVGVDTYSGSPRGKLFIFRFHPEDLEENGAAQPVAQIDLPYEVNSTPLVLPDDSVVVQMLYKVQCWDVSGINSDPPEAPELKWQFPSGYFFYSDGSSPGYGYLDNSGSSAARIFVEGRHGLEGRTIYRINPDTGQYQKVAQLPASSSTFYATPAVGPADGTAEGKNYVYAATAADPTVSHFFAAHADQNGGPPAWQHSIWWGSGMIGALGSPGVLGWQFESGDDISLADIVVGSDDGYVWGFDNLADTAPDLVWTAHPEGSVHISSTAAVTTTRELIFSTETEPTIHLRKFGAEYPAYSTAELDLGDDDHWVFGAPVLDSFGRFYFATPGFPQPPEEPLHDGRRVIGYQLDASGGEWVQFHEIWRYPYEHAFIPPPVVTGPQDWPGYAAPLAMHEDGTIIAVGVHPEQRRVFVVALRPLLGDLNGDSVSNWDDAPALVLALVNPAGWEAQYGAPLGVNLLGVGDGNNDGLFNNFDITPIRDRWDAYGDSEGRDGQWAYYRLLIDELIEYFEQEGDS